MTGAVVTISGNYQSGDTLHFTAQNGISVVSNTGGTLTLTGTTTPANYQTALQSITYSSTSTSTLARTVSFVVKDSGDTGNVNSNTATTQINVVSSATTFSFSVPTINVTKEPYDQTGYFDVTVKESGTGPLAQFQADLLLNGGSSGISFINADLSTTAPYVFNGNSQDISNDGLPFYAGYYGPPGNGPPWDLAATSEAENVDGTNTGTVTLSGNTSYGLMRVEYDIPANTPVGDYSMTFNQDDPNVDPFADWVNTISPESSVYFSPQSVMNGAINVNYAVGNSPVVTTSGSTGQTYTLGDAAVAVDAGIEVSSSDTDITGASEVITNYQSGDTLHFTNQGGISGVYSAGTLTLSGAATPAEYQTALQSVTFSTSSINQTTRTIDVTADDSSASVETGNTGVDTVHVQILAPVLTKPVFELILCSDQRRQFDAQRRRVDAVWGLRRRDCQYSGDRRHAHGLGHVQRHGWRWSVWQFDAHTPMDRRCTE